MIEVTEKATRLVGSYFNSKKKQPIRIFIKIGGCGIRTLGISLESATASDQVFTIDGFKYVVNRKLMRRIQPITVDSDGVGFLLSGNGVNSNSGCGSCSFMCGVRGGTRCSGDCENCNHKCYDGGLRLKKTAKTTTP
jgi:Fe-S cluster assembly iron-binding protein IscA